ncbi:MAG: prolipoprotein diacylglyceryl transferase, partial [Candidatus Gracilibacteria bacterium]|nr:prolipoprotein diacylglyceryl transferase [Candidatus Gracilibacteria bacterium]
MTIFELNFFGINIAPSYYGLMYVLSFLIGYFYIKSKKIINNKKLDDLLLILIVGMILGGRTFYVLFYDLSYYLNNISEIFMPWKGGMSFHGGAFGFIISAYLFCRKNNIKFFGFMDELAIVGAIGIGFGRIGNYINKELLGFKYNGFLAVEKNGNFYFPSPLIEAFLEGLVLFIILFFINKYKKFSGLTSICFLIFYAIFRIFVEIFFRTPDSQIGYIYGFLT